MGKRGGLNRKNIAGMRFGRWLVSKYIGSRKGRALWKCICDCGLSGIVSGGHLMRGESKSCGCLRRDMGKIKNLQHGMAKSNAWNSWAQMIRRCTDKKSVNYHRYGGRGIFVCKDWLNSFESFLNYIGHQPDDGLKYSVDRINGLGNYEPGNVRWATNSAQQRNKKNNRIVFYNGMAMTLVDLAEKTNTPYKLLHSRIVYGCRSVEDAISKQKYRRFS
jgi:hypothetical protein